MDLIEVLYLKNEVEEKSGRIPDINPGSSHVSMCIVVHAHPCTCKNMRTHAYTMYTLSKVGGKKSILLEDIVDGHVIIISLEWLLSNWNIRLTLEE